MAETLLNYGATNTYKTAELAYCAALVYEWTGLPTRWVSADGGGVGHIQALIDAGIIDYVNILTIPRPESYIVALARGNWHDIPVPSKSNPNLMDTKLLRPGGSAQFPDGRKLINDLSKVGAYCFEGLSTIAACLMRSFVGQGAQMGEKVIYKHMEASYDPTKDEELFSAPAQSHYGAVQTQIMSFVAMASAMRLGPGTLPDGRPFEGLVMFSAHESKGKDNITDETILGPAVIGQAATKAVGPAVMDCFHTDRMIETRPYNDGSGSAPREAQMMVVKSYYTPHPDKETGNFWHAAARVSVMSPWGLEDVQATQHNLKLVREKFPGGAIELSTGGNPTGAHIMDYLRLKRDYLAHETKDWKRWRDLQDQRHEETRKAVGKVAEATTAAAVAGPANGKEKPPAKPAS